MDARMPIGGALFAVLVLAGCRDADPLQPIVANDLTTVAAQEAVAPLRPFKGHFAGTSRPGDPCGTAPWEMMLYVEGTGVATHMGAASLDLSACWDMLASIPVGPVSATFTAANGDEIRMTATSFGIEPATGVMTADYDVLGGTGRFEYADGELAVTGQHYPDFSWTSEVTGWIAY